MRFRLELGRPRCSLELCREVLGLGGSFCMPLVNCGMQFGIERQKKQQIVTQKIFRCWPKVDTHRNY